MPTAFLGLGANLGDRRGYLVEALRSLATDPAVLAMVGSSVYESKPVGVLEQPDFMNLVVRVETTHPPLALLSACLAIEARLGRERRERWGPRIIDIDVLAYDQLCWADDRLVLPHPRMTERSFVLTPLAEIAPGLSLQRLPVRELADRVGVEGLSRICSWNDLASVVGIPQA